MAAVWSVFVQVVGTAAAVLAMAALRRLQRTAFWKRVEQRSQGYYENPEISTPTPHDAVRLALADEQSKSVERVAARIQNGASGNRT